MAKRVRCSFSARTLLLKKENDILQNMVNYAKNIHLVYLDCEFNFVKVNQAYAETCGYTPEEMVGKNHFALYPNEENERIFRHVRDTGVPVQFHDKPFVFPDQPERGVTYWDWTLDPIKGRSGKVVGLVFSLVETSERKKAEQALKESEDRFSKAFHVNPTPMAINSVDGCFVDVNASFQELTGFSKEEVVGKRGLELGLYADLTERAEVIRRLREAGRVSNYEMSFKHKSGKLVKVIFSLEKITFNEQLHFLGAAVDITERKKSEEALKESEELYRKLFDKSDDGFILVEPLYDENGNAVDFRILKTNFSYERHIGRKAVSVEGKTAKEIEPDLEPEWIATAGKVAKRGKPLRMESHNKRTGKWFYAQYFPLAKGQVGILFTDVTERKNLEKRLKEKERLAAIGQTAGMVGHDIRNPLQAITSDVFLAKTDLDLMPESKIKQDLRESLLDIEKNVDYVNKIILDLQDFSKSVVPKVQEVFFEPLIRDVLVKKAIPDNIDAFFTVKEDANNIASDPSLLKRILTNLVNNAVQAMPNGGKLAIRTWRDADDIVIAVEDTGVGIPEEVKPKLFTPLFTTKSKGQGFGLAVVKRMTESLGGTVTFESEVDKGTTFMIRLPLKARVDPTNKI